MKTTYEYEPLHLRKNPVFIKKFVHHNSQGRIHWHEAIEVLYFIQGKAVTSCNLQEYNVKKGSILLINGNELHTGIVSQFDSVFYCFQFDPIFFHNMIGNEYVVFENLIQDEKCVELLNNLIDVYMRPRSVKNIIEYKKIAYEFFGLLTERHAKNVLDEVHYKKQFKKLDTFHHIVDYIEKNYTENMSVAELAEQFNMSASYFAHFFKQYAAKSVIEYINETRIQHAKILLEKEELSVNAIALRVGFSDINYFSRKFRSVTGMTPMAYKKNNLYE